VLRTDGDEWELTYLRNDRVLIRRRYTAEVLARADADQRRQDLQHAGWVVHW